MWERVILPQINIEEVIFMKMTKKIFAVTLSVFLLVSVTNIGFKPIFTDGGVVTQAGIDPPGE
jgi:hypothetical protein